MAYVFFKNTALSQGYNTTYLSYEINKFLCLAVEWLIFIKLTYTNTYNNCNKKGRTVKTIHKKFHQAFPPITYWYYPRTYAMCFGENLNVVKVFFCVIYLCKISKVIHIHDDILHSTKNDGALTRISDSGMWRRLWSTKVLL